MTSKIYRDAMISKIYEEAWSIAIKGREAYNAYCSASGVSTPWEKLSNEEREGWKEVTWSLLVILFDRHEEICDIIYNEIYNEIYDEIYDQISKEVRISIENSRNNE